MLDRPDFVAAAPTLPGVPRFRLPPASPHRYDGEATKVSHLHPKQQRLMAHDVLFYVLGVNLSSRFGGTEFPAGPGDRVFGPRGVPDVHRRVVPRAGRILEMFSPAGFEAFFRDIAEADETDRPESRI